MDPMDFMDQMDYLPSSPDPIKFPPMPTYVYETTGKKKRTFEVKQSMNDAPLTHHPETGEPVKRVISGGFGSIIKGKPRKAATPPRPSSGGCGGGCACH
jgi:predicted nucleic acid-binding Zn ribbon protein